MGDGSRQFGEVECDDGREIFSGPSPIDHRPSTIAIPDSRRRITPESSRVRGPSPPCSRMPSWATRSTRPTYEREAPLVRSARPCWRPSANWPPPSSPVVVIVTGVGGAGKAEVVNLLLEWMDARGIRVLRHARPHRARSGAGRRSGGRGRSCPRSGRMAITFGGVVRPARCWTTSSSRISRARCSTRRSTGSSSFEQMLGPRGVLLVVKLWLHLSQGRPARSGSSSSRPTRASAGGCFKRDWKLFRRYDDYRRRRASTCCAAPGGATPRRGRSWRGPTGGTAT